MLPPCLRNLSLLHATPVRLPACLHALTGLQRLYLSECVLEEGCYRTLGAATSLQVRWAGYVLGELVPEDAGAGAVLCCRGLLCWIEGGWLRGLVSETLSV